MDKTKSANATPTFIKPALIQKSSNPRTQDSLNRPKNISIPTSTPLRAPAGRSPKAKSTGKVFGRRSLGRVDPPSFSKRNAPLVPFSIADALNGTLNTHNAKPRRDKCLPKRWDFQIYTDTKQDEMANLMEHSTCVLDISDDEGKSCGKNDRGKENIPPSDLAPTMSLPSSNRSVQASNQSVTETREGPRSALGELNVFHYLQDGQDDGEDASVPESLEDKQPSVEVGEAKALTPASKNDNADKASVTKNPSGLNQQPTILSHEAISNIIQKSTITTSVPCASASDGPSTSRTSKEDAMDIWESESAVEEAVSDSTTTSNIQTADAPEVTTA